MTLTHRPELCTAGGLLHGGVLMSLADSAGGLCAFLGLPEGATTATTSSHTVLLRAVRGGTVTATARVAHRGRRDVVVDTELTDVIGAALRPDPRRRPPADVFREQLARVDLNGTRAPGYKAAAVAVGLLPRRGLRPVTVSVSTEIATYRPERASGGLRPRLRKIATASAGVALTGALLGGAALATYAATNPAAASVCSDQATLGGRISEHLDDATVIDSWCAGDDFVAATVDYPGGAGGGETGPQERLVWRIEGEELIAVADCDEPSLPDSIRDFLGCG